MRSSALQQASPQDLVDVVVSITSRVNLEACVKSNLLILLDGGIPAECFAKHFNVETVADKVLSMTLLESEQAALLRAAGAARAAGPRHQELRRMLPMSAPLPRHEFAWKVIMRHNDTLSQSCFERLITSPCANKGHVEGRRLYAGGHLFVIQPGGLCLRRLRSCCKPRCRLGHPKPCALAFCSVQRSKELPAFCLRYLEDFFMQWVLGPRALHECNLNPLP